MLRGLLLTSALALSTATGSWAESFTLVGDTTGAPTWNRTFGIPPTLSETGTNVAYNRFLITITEPAAFVAEIVSSGFDSYLHLYLGEFDPLQQFLNLVASNDDGGVGLFSLISNSNDGPFDEGQYTLVISSFSNHEFGAFQLFLDGVLLNWGLTAPEQSAEMTAATAYSGRQALRLLSQGTNAATSESLATRGVTVSSKGTGMGAMTGELFVWAKGSRVQSTGSDRSLELPMLQLGADVAVNENVVLGLSFAMGDIAFNTTELTLSGSQRLVQPYVGWKAGDWHGSASLVYGVIDYDDITTSGGSASADGTLRAFTIDAGRDFHLQTGAMVMPFASVKSGVVEFSETGGSLADADIQDTAWFREFSLGTELSAPVGPGRASVSLAADYFDTNATIDLASGRFDQQGWSGTFGLGYQAQLASGMDLGVKVSAGGLGTDQRNLAASLEVGYRF